MNSQQSFEIHQARRNSRFAKLNTPTISLPRAYRSEEGERISFRIKRDTFCVVCDGIIDQIYNISNLQSAQETIDSLARSKSSLGEVNSELSGIIGE